MANITGDAVLVIASVAKQSILSFCGAMDCFAALAMTVGRGVSLPLPLLAFKEGLERADRFLGAHPFAEQMAFLVDPAGQVFRRQF